MITEADVVQGVRDDKLPSPTTFYNASFYALRISGTGAAWRENVKEFCWRSPALWKSKQMQKRWLGAPIILLHPPDSILDTQSFQERVCGSIVAAFVRGEELWCVARILDADAAELLRTCETDTSPAVIFAPGSMATFTMKDGEKMLVEPEPALVDHLAICRAGTWSKGRDVSGVELST